MLLLEKWVDFLCGYLNIIVNYGKWWQIKQNHCSDNDLKLQSIFLNKNHLTAFFLNDSDIGSHKLLCRKSTPSILFYYIFLWLFFMGFYFCSLWIFCDVRWIFLFFDGHIKLNVFQFSIKENLSILLTSAKKNICFYYSTNCQERRKLSFYLFGVQFIFHKSISHQHKKWRRNH